VRKEEAFQQLAEGDDSPSSKQSRRTFVVFLVPVYIKAKKASRVGVSRPFFR
jgi:hypothetical protein